MGYQDDMIDIMTRESDAFIDRVINVLANYPEAEFAPAAQTILQVLAQNYSHSADDNGKMTSAAFSDFIEENLPLLLDLRKQMELGSRGITPAAQQCKRAVQACDDMLEKAIHAGVISPDAAGLQAGIHM